jgi:hypothetical protein
MRYSCDLDLSFAIVQIKRAQRFQAQGRHDAALEAVNRAIDALTKADDTMSAEVSKNWTVEDILAREA